MRVIGKVEMDWAEWIMNKCDQPYDEIEWLVANLTEEAYNEVIDFLNEQANEKWEQH